MKTFFEYNWQVRDEWFDILSSISPDELHKKRIGGVGSIAYTLFHIIDVEYCWIHELQQQVIAPFEFDDYQSLSGIADLSQQLRPEIQTFVDRWQPERELIRLDFYDNDNQIEQFTMGEVMRHVIAHEIHHIGQLSVWAREIGFKPPTANLIRRGLL